MSRVRDTVKHILKKEKGVLVAYLFLGTMVLFAAIRSVARGEHFGVLMCALTLVFFALPSVAERRLHLRFPDFFVISVLAFVFSAEILGEINYYYVRIPLWDSLLHGISGFLFAAFGFAVADVLNRDTRIKFSLSPVWLSLAAFCFSMTVGVIWEFYEFGMDTLFSYDMQKDTFITGFNSVLLDPLKENIPVSVDGIREVTVYLETGESLGLSAYLDVGLYDTMKDLFVNFVGAVVFSVVGYVYLRRKGKWRLAERLIPQFAEAEGEKRGDFE